MKIYNPQPEVLVRLAINKAGEPSQYLTLCETTKAKVEKFVKRVILTQQISPFTTGRVTSVVIREAVGGTNGKSKCVSFKGLSPIFVKELLLNAIEKLKP